MWGALRALVVAAVLVAVPATAWLAGLIWFAAEMPVAVEDDGTATDAIVVLTGGSVRIKTAMELLRSGTAGTLLVSGVHAGVDLAELARTVGDKPSDLADRITLGYTADDTIGNAAETARWMASRGFRSLRLVTAAYHMRRSVLEFRHAMPGVKIVPHPVFPDRVKRDRWWLWPGTASLIATEYTKYLLALARHGLADLQPDRAVAREGNP